MDELTFHYLEMDKSIECEVQEYLNLRICIREISNVQCIIQYIVLKCWHIVMYTHDALLQ